jgi:drug/metabolite transporter (DMT)-like permease
VTVPALGFILAAALVHATWNFLAKRVQGGAEFTWLFSIVSTVLYGPVTAAVILLQRPAFGPAQLAGLGVTIFLELFYILVLQRAYRAADLSLVYPVARGTAPVVATTGAVILFGERPGAVALAGAGLIIAGLLLVAGNLGRLLEPAAAQGIIYALLVGFTIGSYTLWDKFLVTDLGLPPLVLNWAVTAGFSLLLLPAALRRRTEVGLIWQKRRAETVLMGVCFPLSYVLVLTALTFAPVSYIAPAREISVLFGAVLGARVLKEPDFGRRLTGGLLIVGGVIALAVG